MKTVGRIILGLIFILYAALLYLAYYAIASSDGEGFSAILIMFYLLIGLYLLVPFKLLWGKEELYSSPRMFISFVLTIIPIGIICYLINFV